MESEESNFIDILNKLLKDSGKSINSLEELSNFKKFAELIKIM